MSKLNTISAPSLNDSKFGDNIKTQFENINDNFQKLSNYDFTKGEKGDSIDFVDINLAEDEEIRKSLLSLLLGYRSAHIDSEEDGENVEEKFSEAVSFNIESYLKNSTIRMIKLKDDYVGSLPFVYVDERFHHKNVLDDINENPGLYDDEIDLSCIILFENDQFKIVQNFPSLYYDQQVKGLCWKWLGKETAVPANGPQGATGKSTQLLISKIESVSGDGIVLVEAISYNGEWIEAGKNVDINVIHSAIGIPADEDLVNWPTIVIVDGNNDDTESVDTDNSDDESVDTDRSYIYLSNFQKLHDEESGKDYYYVACTNDNRLDLGFNIKSLWEEMIEEPLDKMGIALPTYDGDGDDDPIDFNDKKIKPMHLLYTDPSTGSLTLNKGEIQKSVSGSEYKYEINGVTDRDGNNLIVEGLFNIFYDTVFHYGENKEIRLEKGNIEVSNAAKNTKIAPGHISTQNLETHTLRIKDTTGERSSLTVNSTLSNLISSNQSNNIKAKNNTIEADEINTISAGKNNIVAEEENAIEAKKNNIIGKVEISDETVIKNDLKVTTKITSPLITDKDENVSIELSDNIGIKHRENEIISIGGTDNDKYSIFASKDKLRIGKIDVDFFNSNLNEVKIYFNTPVGEDGNPIDCRFIVYSDLFNNTKDGYNTQRICIGFKTTGAYLFKFTDSNEVDTTELGISINGFMSIKKEPNNQYVLTIQSAALNSDRNKDKSTISIGIPNQIFVDNDIIIDNISFKFEINNTYVACDPQNPSITLNKNNRNVNIVTINENTHFEYTNTTPVGNHEVEINGKLKVAGKDIDGKRISLELGGAIKNIDETKPVGVIGGIESDKGYTVTNAVAGQILMADGDMSAEKPIKIKDGNKEWSLGYDNNEKVFTIDTKGLANIIQEYNEVTPKVFDQVNETNHVTLSCEISGCKCMSIFNGTLTITEQFIEGQFNRDGVYEPQALFTLPNEIPAPMTDQYMYIPIFVGDNNQDFIKEDDVQLGYLVKIGKNRQCKILGVVNALSLFVPLEDVDENKDAILSSIRYRRISFTYICQ